jgi:hypothetical protein
MIQELPAVKFDHLMDMSGPWGTFEHARENLPRKDHGYCTDDVARVLLVCLREPQPSDQVSRLAERSLQFLSDAQDYTGRFFNRRLQDGTWTGFSSSEDCWGRALWALGTASVRGIDIDHRERASVMFEQSAPVGSRWPRSLAFATLGAYERMGEIDDTATSRLMFDARQALDREEMSDDWYWPEPKLTYANAVLPDALLVVGLYYEDAELVSRALGQLEWLLAMETKRGFLSVSPVGGRSLDNPAALFDQQPIEVAALVEACSRALSVTGDERWRRGIELGVNWFMGDNDGGCLMFDPETGGGFDGLTPSGPNVNQGAESTLAMLATMQHAQRWLSDGE